MNFNFSQYIEDDIEEVISGVKGVNSVKIVGPNLETLRLPVPPSGLFRVRNAMARGASR